MARIYSYNILGAQNPTYGISHENITDKLTKDNFFDKAIVRGSDYIWVIKAEKGESRKKTKTVFLVCFLRSDKENEEFSNLQDALDYANNWADYEGDYPLEYETPWVIHTLPFRPRK